MLNKKQKGECMKEKKILFPHRLTWEKIDKNDYKKYNITENKNVEIASAFFVKCDNLSKVAVVLYDFGNNDSIIDDLKTSCELVYNDVTLQDEYSIVPIVFKNDKIDDKNVFITLIKPLTSEGNLSFDLYFTIVNKTYCFHTLVKDNGEDYSNFSLEIMENKFKYIKEITSAVREAI